MVRNFLDLVTAEQLPAGTPVARKVHGGNPFVTPEVLSTLTLTLTLTLT